MKCPICNAELIWGSPSADDLSLAAEGELILCQFSDDGRNRCPQCQVIIWERKGVHLKANMPYDFDGCLDGLIQGCLTCPLDRCRYDDDDSRKWKGLLIEQRASVACELEARGYHIREVAELLGVSRREAYRYRERLKALR